ncbi:S8 family peptidase [Duganella callida]|uniref:S8 family peptidase n=1 Tax=Duganella callida TaxID=2561932 RepID=A0A4Y9S6L5_9BURK|nr:S8 family peptidase [Duganella callida]TFW16852.1 S8 family peptidase [Duganella callida]
MKRHTLSLAVLALLAGMGQAAHAEDVRRPYLVRLTDKPVAGYSGGVAGLAATQPAPGATLHLNLNAPNVQLYGAYLDQKRAAAKAVVASAPVGHEYSLVFNGFSAQLTDAEVRALKASGTVAAIVPNTPRHMLTTYTPTFLGLDGPNGLWTQLGGQEHAGEDVVVGIIDGGIWPENPAYADRVDSNGLPTFDSSAALAYGPAPASWKGVCQTGEAFTAAHCNNKLIGAQYFDADFQMLGMTPHWTEFRSPRDSIGGTLGHGGHGTHTSTTAAGNRTPAKVSGIDMGKVSGMAPRARIAMYKVCWSYNDDSEANGAGSGCWAGDSVAAIEQAVRDGVNVLNFSISGAETVDDPVEEAFRQASNAGIFVAAAAGNAGPKQTMNHVGPWLTTVAASSHDREFVANLALASGVSYTGASLNAKDLPRTPMVRAEDVAVGGVEPSMVTKCYPASANGGLPVLDPVKVAGKIVICERGDIDRVAKSRAVLEAGGSGMVMVDDGLGPVADVHSVPTVHVSAEDGAKILAYAAGKDAAAGMSHFSMRVGQVPAPIVAAFSSRGPNRYETNQIKPDMAAPGVDILAGVTPELRPEQKQQLLDGTLTPPSDWAFYQGTSMATPHVAGLAALLHQRHPGWSPAAIKSALMTTAFDTQPDALRDMQVGTLPWGQGAGQVKPTAAADPGLVYDISAADYVKYLCGIGRYDDCSGGTIKSSNLNLASIAASNVMGAETITRTVTNVSDKPATYTATASMTGYSVAVSPATLTLAPGESKSFNVTLTRTYASDDMWQYGQLTWRDGVHTVRSPIAAKSSRAITAPELLTADLASGSKLVSVATGFAGKLGIKAGGMQEVKRTALTVSPAPTGTADTLAQAAASCNAGVPGVTLLPFSIPADTVVARFETFARDIDGDTAGRQDVDLALMKDGKLIDYSMLVGSNESITRAAPAPGEYQLCVIGYDLQPGSVAKLSVSSAIVPRGDNGSLKVAAPPRVYAGSTSTMGVSWSGLASGKRYIGAIGLLDPSGNAAATTVLAVDTDDAIPVAAGLSREIKRRPEL